MGLDFGAIYDQSDCHWLCSHRQCDSCQSRWATNYRASIETIAVLWTKYCCHCRSAMARLRAIAPLCKVDIWCYYRYALGSYGGRYIGTRCATMDSDWADYDSTIRIYEVDDDH